MWMLIYIQCIYMIYTMYIHEMYLEYICHNLTSADICRENALYHFKLLVTFWYQSRYCLDMWYTWYMFRHVIYLVYTRYITCLNINVLVIPKSDKKFEMGIRQSHGKYDIWQVYTCNMIHNVIWQVYIYLVYDNVIWQVCIYLVYVRYTSNIVI